MVVFTLPRRRDTSRVACRVSEARVNLTSCVDDPTGFSFTPTSGHCVELNEELTVAFYWRRAVRRCASRLSMAHGCALEV
jgi:hypothetical protein